uniref:PDZ and LIM domain protein 1 n=1 Tax=Theropithecus gelada TaxID=9565 RepID=A0A8D2ER01_THEGE
MPRPILLQGPRPRGFCFVGNKDFEQPLAISRVTPRSKVALANLCIRDIITTIDGENSRNMTHLEAQNRIKGCTDNMTFTVARSKHKVWSPLVTEEGKCHPYKMNLASEPREVLHIGSAHNGSSMPFTTSPARSTAPCVIDTESKVYEMHQEKQEKRDPNKPSGFGSVEAPVTKVAALIGNAQKLPMCDKCGPGIVGVKLRDHHRHPECYVCTDCGTSLKQKGHFFVEDQIHCEKHAWERVTPPEGYEVVTLFPK